MVTFLCSTFPPSVHEEITGGQVKRAERRGPTVFFPPTIWKKSYRNKLPGEEQEDLVVVVVAVVGEGGVLELLGTFSLQLLNSNGSCNSSIAFPFFFFLWTRWNSRDYCFLKSSCFKEQVSRLETLNGSFMAAFSLVYSNIFEIVVGSLCYFPGVAWLQRPFASIFPVSLTGSPIAGHTPRARNSHWTSRHQLRILPVYKNFSTDGHQIWRNRVLLLEIEADFVLTCGLNYRLLLLLLPLLRNYHFLLFRNARLLLLLLLLLPGLNSITRISSNRRIKSSIDDVTSLFPPRLAASIFFWIIYRSAIFIIAAFSSFFSLVDSNHKPPAPSFLHVESCVTSFTNGIYIILNNGLIFDSEMEEREN